MNISCYILDDEPHAVTALADLIKTTPGLELIGNSTRAMTGFYEITAMRPHITFLDIDMPDLNGLQIAPLIKEFTKVIFCTAFREYGSEAFETDALDYLLKPVSHERLLKAIAKYHTTIPGMTNMDTGYLLLKTGVKGQLTKVPVKDIMYIRGASNYIELHWSENKTLAYLTLAEALDKLPAAHFFRVSKSFIVNEHFISRIDGGRLILTKNTEIAIGQAYLTSFREKMAPHMVKSKWDR